MTITQGLLEEIDAAMVQAMTAIDDWLSIHASDMCDDARVEEARKRVNEHGTLWYISCVQKVNSDVLDKLREARQAEAAPAMSAETMREAAANVADKCAEQNKAAAMMLEYIDKPGPMVRYVTAGEARAALARIEAAYREAVAENDHYAGENERLDDEIINTRGIVLEREATITDLRGQLAAAKAGDADLRQQLSEIGHRVARLDAIGALKETL